MAAYKVKRAAEDAGFAASEAARAALAQHKDKARALGRGGLGCGWGSQLGAEC